MEHGWDPFRVVGRQPHPGVPRATWHLLDAADALDRLAVKRNGYSDPADALRDFYAHRPDHPLLQLDPIPSLLMLQTEPRQRQMAPVPVELFAGEAGRWGRHRGTGVMDEVVNQTKRGVVRRGSGRGRSRFGYLFRP